MIWLIYRKKYSSESDSCDGHHKGHSESSSCPEIKQLVQSSLNSAASAGFEKNRSSRQSKTSMDVAVQANAHDLDLEMNKKNDEDGKLSKSKQTKTRENKKYRRANKYKENDMDMSKTADKIRRSKEKYRNDGNAQEKQKIFSETNDKCSEFSEDDVPVIIVHKKI